MTPKECDPFQLSHFDHIEEDQIEALVDGNHCKTLKNIPRKLVSQLFVKRILLVIDQVRLINSSKA